jgi:hypothetical protein
MRVLVVDDSERVRKTLATGLKARGMAVETAADGAEALALINGLPFDQRTVGGRGRVGGRRGTLPDGGRRIGTHGGALHRGR